MTAPINLPRNFDGQTMTKVVHALVCSTVRKKLPDEIVFDFSTLNFVRPAGVTFLNNLVRWLQAKGTKVKFSGLDQTKQVIAYLDDSLFFQYHTGKTLRPSATPRNTTLPLREVKSVDSHMWLRRHFVPWLAERIGVPKGSLSEIQTCVSELFNNIKDHTRYDIGSIFVQHFPREDRVIIAVSDFGLGIPENVRTIEPTLRDAEAIVRAVQEGFTTRTTPRNRGAGLDYLLRIVALSNAGLVTIYSGNAIVCFSGSDGVVAHRVVGQDGYSPGTMFEIELRTDTISAIDDDSEEFEW